jgi:hypothetical protein
MPRDARGGRIDGRVIAMGRILVLHKKWMDVPSDREAYEVLEERFVLDAAAIGANGAKESCQ